MTTDRRSSSARRAPREPPRTRPRSVHQRVGAAQAPVREARDAKDSIENRAGDTHAPGIGRRHESSRHAEAWIAWRQAVLGGGHEVLTLTRLAELAIDDEIEGARAELRPLGKRHVQWASERQPCPGRVRSKQGGW